jgi:hypothetical protein
MARIAMVFDVRLDRFFGNRRPKRLFALARAGERTRFPELPLTNAAREYPIGRRPNHACRALSLPALRKCRIRFSRRTRKLAVATEAESEWS